MKSLSTILAILFGSFFFRHLFYTDPEFTLLNPACDFQDFSAHPILAPFASLTLAISVLLPVWASRFYFLVKPKLGPLAWASTVLIALFGGFLASFHLVPDQILFAYYTKFDGYFSIDRSKLPRQLLLISILFLFVFAFMLANDYWKNRQKLSISIKDILLAIAASALFFTAGRFGNFWSEFGRNSFNGSLVSSLQIFLVFAVTLGLIRFFGRWRYGAIATVAILPLVPLIVLLLFYAYGHQHIAVTRYSIFLTLNMLTTTFAILIWDNVIKKRAVEPAIEG